MCCTQPSDERVGAFFFSFFAADKISRDVQQGCLLISEDDCMRSYFLNYFFSGKFYKEHASINEMDCSFC